VTADADAEAAAEGLVDGVCYNAGQSCCGVERIYVHESKYDQFLEKAKSPIVGVERVSSDAEAIQKINDSKYGLTASVFSSDREHAMALGAQISAGTVYMNRCDVLDPYLPWTGTRDSGKGISLSKHGFRGVTKLKSVSHYCCFLLWLCFHANELPCLLGLFFEVELPRLEVTRLKASCP
jgi:acyl-CoA reductase-like NAD-dependent aldehyde dehydrogenase